MPNVRVFGTITSELEAAADWLHQERVESVAIESTGTYWIPLYNDLVLHRHRDFDLAMETISGPGCLGVQGALNLYENLRLSRNHRIVKGLTKGTGARSDQECPGDAQCSVTHLVANDGAGSP